ncbi:MAG TPA: outer membrane beta-barrel protein, partial [Gemmatimonadales bacterium]|nr:outer membrane beta-barrel protein [Gemmatimonadales bacterium]
PRAAVAGIAAVRLATASLVVLSGLAGPLAAQRAHHFELGGSVAATRYDHLMGLPDHVGVLVHVGYFLTPVFALEAAGGFSQPHTAIPFEFTTVSWAGASVVLNFPLGSRQLPYLMGGYTRIRYGGDPPYDYGDHAVHGAIGDRVFLFPGAALRIEGRAIFAPHTDARFDGRWAGHVVGSLGVSLFTGGRRTSQGAGR